MQPIDRTQLAHVTGGAGGAILGSLLQNAGPIMNGVASIIGAAKGGGGGGAAAAPAADPSAGAAAAGPPPGSGGGGGGGGGGGANPLVAISVSINGVKAV
jgi:hypothetical protein